MNIDSLKKDILDAKQYNEIVLFKDLFPTSIGGLTFQSTATDVQYFTVDVGFKYTIYDIYNINDTKL